MRKPDNISIECREMMGQICEHLGENFDSPSCKQILEHLEYCEDCRAYLDSLKKTVRIYQQVKTDVPEHLTASILKNLPAQK